LSEGRQVLPDEFLIQPKLLRVFEHHEAIGKYLNSFCQNTKRGIKKSLGKLHDEVFCCVPESVLRKLKIHLVQLDNNDESFPNLRTVQISHESDPSYAFQSVIELVSFKLGHYTFEDDNNRGNYI